jgi:hypothetical protein
LHVFRWSSSGDHSQCPGICHRIRSSRNTVGERPSQGTLCSACHAQRLTIEFRIRSMGFRNTDNCRLFTSSIRRYCQRSHINMPIDSTLLGIVWLRASLTRKGDIEGCYGIELWPRSSSLTCLSDCQCGNLSEIVYFPLMKRLCFYCFWNTDYSRLIRRYVAKDYYALGDDDLLSIPFFNSSTPLPRC